ncbi:MAG: type II CAAX endopeptidase family protein, partial [Anaerolineae bacterium]
EVKPMTSLTISRPKDWQKRTWVQVLAILVGYGSTYIPTILSHLGRDRPLSVKDILFYTTVVGGIGIIVMLLLLRYLCGERVRDLNLRPGTWWKDVLFGIGLVVVTLGTHTLLRGPLMRLFPPAPGSGLGDRFFNELVADPVLFGLMIGPGLIIGAGVFEELSRIFLLTRLWNINPSQAGRWFGIVLSAALFGLAHLYQGPAGMISTGISGLILAVYYHALGRVLPMMLSHYLHDAIQFAAVYIMVNAS